MTRPPVILKDGTKIVPVDRGDHTEWLINGDPDRVMTSAQYDEFTEVIRARARMPRNPVTIIQVGG